MSTGIVLAGAAALGAYEAGVAHYILDEVARELEQPHLLDVICGTSAGAINATALATFADQPRYGATQTCDAWRGLQLGRILRPSAVELLLAAVEARGPTARLARALHIRRARGGLLDPRPIVKLLTELLPTGRISDHIAAGLLRGIAISATHIATGRAAVFYEAPERIPAWLADPAMIPIPTRVGISHAMASAAIPLLFPPVEIDGDRYCDGGLRQMVPLAPSIRLGADRLVVINPLTPANDVFDEEARREAATSPLYLAGKALNALFVDRTEVDLARLDQLTAILRAGERRFGARFQSELNAELLRDGVAPIREVVTLRIDPSRDLGRIAAEYVSSKQFARRERGAIGRLMRCLAESGPTRAGDLLSYLLFDGGYASELIALGRADARVRHSELCAFLSKPRFARASM
jgi:NTE family protein